MGTGFGSSVNVILFAKIPLDDVDKEEDDGRADGQRHILTPMMGHLCTCEVALQGR